jgi:hypothetical protein
MGWSSAVGWNNEGWNRSGYTQDGILRAPANMTSNTAPSPFVSSASSVFGANQFPSWLAFDGNDTTFWHSGTGILPEWLKIDLGTSQFCATYKIVDRGAGLHMPTSFTLAGSPDDVTYTTVDTQTGVTWTDVAGVVHTFTPPTPMQFRYWKLNVTASESGADYVNISTLGIYS